MNKKEEKRDLIIPRQPSFKVEYFFNSIGWVIKEQDPRSLLLKQIDLEKIILKKVMLLEEKSLTGEERYRRLKKEKNILLDAMILKLLLEDQSLIKPDWFKNVKKISFDGTIFHYFSQPDTALVLCLEKDDYFGIYRWDSFYHSDILSEEIASATFLE